MPGFRVWGVVSRVYKIIVSMFVKSQRNVFLIYNFFAIVHQGTQDAITFHLLAVSETVIAAYPYNAKIVST